MNLLKVQAIGKGVKELFWGSMISKKTEDLFHVFFRLGGGEEKNFFGFHTIKTQKSTKKFLGA